MDQYLEAQKEIVTVTTAQAGIMPQLSTSTQLWVDALDEAEQRVSGFDHVVRNVAQKNKDAMADMAREAKRQLDIYNQAIDEFSLDAGMRWTDYYRGVEDQAAEFATDREGLEAKHQENLAELIRQGQSKAIQIDEEAEWAKLALLEDRLDIELQRRSEFTDKTKTSQRMAKDLAIRNLQAQIAEQKTILDSYYAGTLIAAGKNVDALIAEEDRRHKEAIAGLEEEIEKTKELQRQQLGTLLLQTFETWAEIKDIPPEKMLEMRTAIAKEYGLISAEEAQLVGLSIKTWDQWALDFSKSADQVTTELGINIQYVQDLQAALDGLPSEKVIDIIIRPRRTHRWDRE
jgi:hypothetical protein